MNPLSRTDEHRILEVLSSLSYRTGELKPYLQKVAEGVSQLIGLDWSVVTLCQSGEERVLASTIELDNEQTYSLHGTLTGTVVESGRPLVVPDARTCHDYGDPPEGYHAYLGVPLRTSFGEVIGTICSFQRQPRQFTEQEIGLATIFAERAATAIDNYQLYQQQQQFNDLLEAEVIKRTVELRAAQSQLLAANLQLEQRVEQRTAELQQANLHLQAEIVERQQTEAALRQSEERLRQIAENMQQVLWMYTANGEPIYINPAFETIWQRPCADWYADADRLWLSIHPDDRQRVKQGFAQAQDGKYEEEYRIIRPDGSVRLIRDQAFPIRDGRGQIYRIAGIAEDITERTQAQQERTKAIAALAEVGELAAMIVHEVRNPLTTVLMGLTALQRVELSDLMQERLALAVEEADRIRNLLKEILVYAKPQTLQPALLDLTELIEEWLPFIRTMPSTLSRRVELSIIPTPIVVMGDRDKLKQVFINLIDNACEAVGEGDTVLWTVECQGDRVQIQIQNGGQPIPPENLAKLTKPFFTTKSTGTGLGLAIVKRIVEAHGGELQIESTAATGTMVRVLLPLAN